MAIKKCKAPVKKSVPKPAASLAETSNCAYVRYAAGATINAGNYESVRIDVGITLPSDMADIERVYKNAKKFVEDKLYAEVTKARQL